MAGRHADPIATRAPRPSRRVRGTPPFSRSSSTRGVGSWFEPGSVNRGSLLEPARPAPSEALVLANGELLPSGFLDRRWTLVHLATRGLRGGLRGRASDDAPSPPCPRSAPGAGAAAAACPGRSVPPGRGGSSGGGRYSRLASGASRFRERRDGNRGRNLARRSAALRDLVLSGRGQDRARSRTTLRASSSSRSGRRDDPGWPAGTAGLMRGPRFRRLALAVAVLAFAVTVLGAWVRLTGAGLGCPDWPGCYGRMVIGPDGSGLEAAVEGGKAWRRRWSIATSRGALGARDPRARGHRGP